MDGRSSRQLMGRSTRPSANNRQPWENEMKGRSNGWRLPSWRRLSRFFMAAHLSRGMRLTTCPSSWNRMPKEEANPGRVYHFLHFSSSRIWRFFRLAVFLIRGSFMKRKVDRVTANHYLSLTASQETSKRALTYRTGNSLHELECLVKENKIHIRRK